MYIYVCNVLQAPLLPDDWEANSLSFMLSFLHALYSCICLACLYLRFCGQPCCSTTGRGTHSPVETNPADSKLTDEIGTPDPQLEPLIASLEKYKIC